MDLVMGEQVRWNVTVSRELDVDLRAFLAERDGDEKDFSLFVEQAVSRALFLDVLNAVHARNAGLDPDEIERIIDEELAEVRKERRAKRAA